MILYIHSIEYMTRYKRIIISFICKLSRSNRTSRYEVTANLRLPPPKSSNNCTCNRSAACQCQNSLHTIKLWVELKLDPSPENQKITRSDYMASVICRLKFESHLLSDLFTKPWHTLQV